MEIRYFYYNAGWQVLEERLESDSVIASYADRQNVWGMRYVDDRIRDPSALLREEPRMNADERRFFERSMEMF